MQERTSFGSEETREHLEEKRGYDENISIRKNTWIDGTISKYSTHRQMVNEYLCELMKRQYHMDKDLLSASPIMILIMKILLRNVYKCNNK